MVFQSIGHAKRITKLSYLGNIGVSGKIKKSEKENNTMTYCLYLSPADTSGKNVCPASTSECRKGCLATSGRTKMELIANKRVITNARIKKTSLFFNNRPFFMGWLISEIEKAKIKANKNNMDFAVRLNGTSDIDWSSILYKGKNVFQHFPDIMFYDYTKNINYFKSISKNYKLTLSYTGRNWNACQENLNAGFNVAMIFNIPVNQKLPIMFSGYEVIDGDITDLRIRDKKGIIVGLRWKNIANKKVNEEIKNSIFVIQPNNELCVFKNN